MSEKPKIAGRAPVKVKLEAGKNYAFCTCGGSASQPFCDGTHKGTEFRPHRFSVEADQEWWLCMCKQTGNVPRCDGTHKTLPPEGASS